MSLLFKYFKRIFSENKIVFMLAFALSIFIAFLELLVPLFIKFYIDIVQKGVEIKYTIIYIAIFITGLLLINILNVFWYQILTLMASKTLGNLRNSIFKVVSSAPFEVLSDMGKDNLKNILFSDVMTIYGSACNFSLRLFSNVVMLILFLLVTFFINPFLSLILICAFGIGFFISSISRKVILNCSRNVNFELKNMNKVTNNYIDALELYKTNNLDTYIVDKHHVSLTQFVKVALRNDFVQVFLKNLLSNLNQIFTLLIMTYLILFSKNYSVGDLFFLYFVSNTVFKFSLDTQVLIASIHSSLPSFEHVDSLLNLKNNSDFINATMPFYEVSFRDVSFKYAKSTTCEYVLKNMNAVFKSGDIVHISGVNGSGKSTFVKLLAGLLEATDGEISINQIDRKHYPNEIKRKKILYISQDEHFLHETIKNYSSKMNFDITQDDLLAFLSDWDFLTESKETGTLDYELVDIARNLSGGQRKKLLVLKLYSKIKDSDIIIIDEMEAGMDSKTLLKYYNFQEKLFLQHKNKIIFVISHKNSIDPIFTKRVKIQAGDLCTY